MSIAVLCDIHNIYYSTFGITLLECSNLVHCDLNYNKFLMLSTGMYREWTERSTLSLYIEPILCYIIML